MGLSFRRIALFLILWLIWIPAFSALAQREAFVARLEGPINPATASYVKRAIDAAEERKAEVLILEIDTPGGLVTSMKSIVKDIMNSKVPVVTYVAPKGAGAASAGVLVTIAGHIAAMAPGTNIGAAHPVSVGGKDMDKAMTEKVLNDMVSYARSIAKEKNRNAEWVEKAVRESASITAEVALRENVVELISEDLDSLLEAIDGRKVLLRGELVKLDTKECEKFYFKPSWRDRLLITISDPNIAYILMMIGLAGIYFELSHPGSIFPGVIGGISLILAFYSFQTLPVNYAGLLLIILSVVLFILEIKVQSYGMLSFGGILSLVLGSIMLFEDVRISWKLLIPTVAGIGGFFVAVAGLAIKAIWRKPLTGQEGIIGEIGVAKTPVDKSGKVFVHGEYWNALSEEPIQAGEEVRVVGMEGLVLKVKRKE